MDESLKEPLQILLSALGYLVILGAILTSVIVWMTSYTLKWEFIVSLIFIIITGFLILFVLYMVLSTSIEVIKEVRLIIEIRKEEREENQELISKIEQTQS